MKREHEAFIKQFNNFILGRQDLIPKESAEDIRVRNKYECLYKELYNTLHDKKSKKLLIDFCDTISEMLGLANDQWYRRGLRDALRIIFVAMKHQGTIEESISETVTHAELFEDMLIDMAKITLEDSPGVLKGR